MLTDSFHTKKLNQHGINIKTKYIVVCIYLTVLVTSNIRFSIE